MKSKPNFLGVFLVFLVVLAIAHLITYLAFYGTGYKGFAEKGISGLAIGENSGSGSFPISEIILFLEWGLIILGAIVVYAKHKLDLKKEIYGLNMLKEKKHFKGGTELDNFYELLRDMKHFRLSTASKVFNVDIDIIEDWARSLETGKVAELAYPRIGGPEIRIIPEENEQQKQEINKEKLTLQTEAK
jgi:hypothetical protein